MNDKKGSESIPGLETNISSEVESLFQAKNIRQTDYKIAVDRFESQLKDPALSEDARRFINEKAAAYRARIARYDSEPETGEGKKELLAKARSLEAERDLALKRDPYFDFGQGFLQIAIVLASVSLIIGSSALLWFSGGLGVIGTLAMINAFTLLVSVPYFS